MLCRKAKCSFHKVTWEPGFGSATTLKRGEPLPASASVSEDDTIKVSVSIECAVSAPAYASITCEDASGKGTATLLKAGSGSGQFSGRWQAADLAAQVCYMCACMHNVISLPI